MIVKSDWDCGAMHLSKSSKVFKESLTMNLRAFVESNEMR
jgi:hypothetical protein